MDELLTKRPGILAFKTTKNIIPLGAGINYQPAVMTYSLRKTKLFETELNRVDIRIRSNTARIPIIWQNLSEDLRNIETLPLFKFRLFETVFTSQCECIETNLLST